MSEVFYRMNSPEAIVTPLRVVDAHSLLHLKTPKSVRACDAADAVDGLVIVQNPTLRVAAMAWGVSIGHVARARHLPPEERARVRRGERPLVLPAILPAMAKSSPVPACEEEKLTEVIDALGVSGTLDLMARLERARPICW
jgi:hypothetical protein